MTTAPAVPSPPPTEPAPPSAPSSTVVSPPAAPTVATCGDCAADLVAVGLAKASGGTIGLGVSCAVHPTGNAPHATSLFVHSGPINPLRALTVKALAARRAKAAADRPTFAGSPRTAGAELADLAARHAPDAPFGAGAPDFDVMQRDLSARAARSLDRHRVHETALALLCAWSHGDGTKVDDLAIENAVIAARKIRDAVAKE
jgi:hypothetical protein